MSRQFLEEIEYCIGILKRKWNHDSGIECCVTIPMTKLVYHPPAINLRTGEEVAVKLEHSKARHPQLHTECRFYKTMQGGGEWSRSKIKAHKLDQASFFLPTRLWYTQLLSPQSASRR